LKVFVLGATGFLGSNLVAELLRRGDDVVAFSPDRDRLDLMRRHGVETVEGDFLRPETLDLSFEHVDWLVHLASTTTPSESVADPVRDAANLSASRAVIGRAISAGVKKILFSSSGGTIYGDAKDVAVREDAATHPVVPYTRTKLAIESALITMCEGTATVPVVLRFGNPYGPNQSPARGTGVVTAWLRAIRDGRPIPVYGSLKNARDFFYVSDAVRAMTLALECEGARGVYNIGSGRPTTLEEVLHTMEDVTGRRVQVVESAVRRSDVVKVIALDSSKAMREFGWKALVPLRDGLKMTWDWVCAGEPFRVG